MIRIGNLLGAIAVLVAVECYLRPSEVLGLRRSGLLPPTQQGVPHWVVLLFPDAGVERSKVGSSDDTIPLDSRRMPWIGAVCQSLAVGPPEEKVFKQDYPAFARSFKVAARALGIDLVPYQMRHSGASLDRAKGLRTLEATQKRGRWTSLASVRRYEKHGRLNDT